MEEKRGTLSHFSGIIRLIAFILLVVIILFFVFRWASNRRAEQRAEEAVKTAVTQEEKPEEANTEEAPTEVESSTDEAKPAESGTAGVVEVPSGVEESDTPAPSAGVPEVGMAEDALLSTFFISTAVYLIVKNHHLQKQLKGSA